MIEQMITARTMGTEGARKALLLRAGVSILLMFCFAVAAFGQAQFSGKDISELSIVFEDGELDGTAEELRIIAQNAVGDKYSTVRIRDAIDAIYALGTIAAVTVEAADAASNSVILRFRITRRPRASRVRVEIIGPKQNEITEQDIRFKLNLIEAGRTISEQTLRDNADRILEFLRDRGYIKAEVAYVQNPRQGQNEVEVIFRVTPNEQAKVESFFIDIPDLDTRKLNEKIKLKPGEGFSREQLVADVERIRKELRDLGFLAPRLDEPRVVYDSELNLMSISIRGEKGPIVEVVVEAERNRVGEGTQNRLLPVKREGTLDYGAIIEGERRLETHYQEIGYFFADVTSVCSVAPPLLEGEATFILNESAALCSSLSSAELTGKTVEVKYIVDLNRRLKLVDIRLRGAEDVSVETTRDGKVREAGMFNIDEIRSVLESQEANILGIIPLFGYGRGYTSANILEEDAATITSLLRELGYRNADVRVNQGVSLDGENLIITFVVDPGEPTVIDKVDIVGNFAFTDDELTAEIPDINDLSGRYFSRAKVNTIVKQLAEFYSREGFYDASVRFSVDERSEDPQTGLPTFNIALNIENEGRRVFIDRILVSGNEDTKTSAIERALTLRSGEFLRATDIYSSEQNLYSSDVFANVDIKARASGQRDDGSPTRDVLVDVEEQAPRLLTYGGGFSTDLGANGFVDLRHLNLLGRLWQGGVRLRMSRRQQLVQVDYVNPRFLSEGNNRFAPLTITAAFQRDSTVTRFFRSEFDRGTHGIVQRVDEKGNPIDRFGDRTGEPLLQRLTISAETNRTLSLKSRSAIFVRYRYEDVRITNVDSLLIRDILVPDSKVRISGFGATFVRDTRERCNIEYGLLDIIARGGPGEECRYSASDPTTGSYMTLEYNVSLPQLGANIGFNKFQASYNFYHTVPYFNRVTFAARAILGVANVFSEGDRFDPVQFPGFDGLLPISERFFAGGANTLRGFDFESAGPRYVVVPQGTFLNSDGEQIFLEPFSIPFGGNAIAIINLEARIPINKAFRVVPFYDGGNVFAKIRDIFNPPDGPPNDPNRQNLRVLWSHTVGLGLRIKTPIGGEVGVDYGYLLNPPQFVIPQGANVPPAFYRLPQGQFHFRFSQAF